MNFFKRITAVVLVVSVLIVSVFTSCGNDDKKVTSTPLLNQHSNEWVESIEHMQIQYPSVAAGEFEFISEEDWMSQLDELKAKIQSEAMTDNEIYYSIMEIMAQVKNSHTSMTCPYLKGEYIPVVLKYIDGKFYITASLDEYVDLIGKELISVNDHPISEVFEAYCRTYSCENEQFIYSTLSSSPISHDLLVYVGISNDGASYATLETPQGKTNVSIVSNDDYLTKQYNVIGINQKYNLKPFTSSIPEGQSQFYWYNIDEENRAFYFQFNNFVDRNTYYEYLRAYNQEDQYRESDATAYPVFSEFTTEMFTDMQKNDSKFDKVVIDLRKNTGGSYDLFYNEFKKYEDYLANKEVLVLIDNITFSASIFACEYLHATYGAKFIGCQTSGAIGGYTSVNSFTLRGTECVLSYSSRKFDYCKSLRERQDNEYDGVKPDIIVYNTIEDYLSGYDRVYMTAVDASK